MSLFRSSATGFAALALEGTLAPRIADQMLHGMGRRAGRSEVRSWEMSHPVLANDLLQAGLDQVEVLVEHPLPLSSKRIDVVLAGQHPRTGQPSYVVVELKQWSAASSYEGDSSLVSIASYGRPVLHPVAQVRGSCLKGGLSWMTRPPSDIGGRAGRQCRSAPRCPPPQLRAA